MCHYLQWNLFSYNTWSYGKMVKFVSLLENNLLKNTIPFVLVKCMDHYVLLVLAQCDTIYITFNLLMSRIGLMPLCSL
jgi:hypothetical protein